MMFTSPEVDKEIEKDALTVFEAVNKGGIAIVYLDVAYSILAKTEEAVKKIYSAKGRSFSKPTGIVGCKEIHHALHILDDFAFSTVESITVKHNLPLAVIAPYQKEHAFLKKMDPFVLANAVKDDTLNLLLNAGKVRNKIGELSWLHQTPFVGSFANKSLTGSKYNVSDIEQELLEISDVILDYGQSIYHNAEGKSSTMIDFRDFSIVRKGVCFDEIEAVFRDEFSIELKGK
jgi:tRNA A37 threonylcarbamoyladenosine synthetase subunit TsaC/SUA5/YrdC